LIESDLDAPEATDEELAQARPFREVFPELAESIDRERHKVTLSDVPDNQWTDKHEAELRRRIAANPDDFLLPKDAKGAIPRRGVSGMAQGN
jgi:hypothetical protein